MASNLSLPHHLHAYLYMYALILLVFGLFKSTTAALNCAGSGYVGTAVCNLGNIFNSKIK